MSVTRSVKLNDVNLTAADWGITDTENADELTRRLNNALLVAVNEPDSDWDSTVDSLMRIIGETSSSTHGLHKIATFIYGEPSWMQ